MSDSVRPQRWQLTRLFCPWDSPGKNTGVRCHFLLQCMKVKSESEVAQSCPTLSDPMDCSLPGSPIHGIFQARVLEWGAIAFLNRKLVHFIFKITLHLQDIFFFTILCKPFKSFRCWPCNLPPKHLFFLSILYMNVSLNWFYQLWNIAVGSSWQ